MGLIVVVLVPLITSGIFSCRNGYLAKLHFRNIEGKIRTQHNTALSCFDTCPVYSPKMHFTLFLFSFSTLHKEKVQPGSVGVCVGVYFCVCVCVCV